LKKIADHLAEGLQTLDDSNASTHLTFEKINEYFNSGKTKNAAA